MLFVCYCISNSNASMFHFTSQCLEALISFLSALTQMNPTGTRFKFWVLTPYHMTGQFSQSESSAQISAQEERGEYRKRKTGTSSNLCPWVRKHSLLVKTGAGNISSHSLWIICLVFWGTLMEHNRVKGFPSVGKSLRMCPGTEWGEVEGGQQQFSPHLFTSSAEEWGQELWPSVWVEAVKPELV